MNRRYFLTKSSASALLVGSTGAALARIHTPNRSDLKISDVKVYQLEKGKDKAVFVKVGTDEGTSGWGECSPNSSPIIAELVLRPG